VAARQYPGVCAELPEQRNGLVDAVRLVIVEIARIHGFSPVWLRRAIAALLVSAG
jgi:hypothetical protein